MKFLKVLIAACSTFVVLSALSTRAVAAVPTVSIKASASSITSGQTDTLTVTETGAASIHVTGSNGTAYTLPYSGGTLTVAPTTTTTYTATATNSSGNATAQTTITVSPGSGSGSGAPTVSITAASSSIQAGQSDTLTVTETRAGSLKVTGSDGTSYILPYSGGTITVSPTSTTTYTATATNSSGSTTSQVTITVLANTPTPTVSISAQNSSITQGSSDALTVTAINATSVLVTGSDGSSYSLSSTGGTLTVTPAATTTYTAQASNASGTTASAQTTVTVGPAGSGVSKIQHVIFMLQENRTFDSYFGMLNPYRKSNGWDVGDDGKTYDVDGVDDKLNTIVNKDDEGDAYYLYKFRTTCIDGATSDWIASYGDVNRYNFLTTRPILMDGFVHNAEGLAKNCTATGKCIGDYSDVTGQRAMGYYDQDFLNYYYYMASQFAVSDRWFSPVSSKSTPNRIATFAGGTTQGLVYDRGTDEKLPQEVSKTIFQELNEAGVSWKIYYQKTASNYPQTFFSQFGYANQFLFPKTSTNSCTGTTQPSSVVGDSTNSFCVDPNHLAPLSQYYSDLQNNALPAFAFIEAGDSDEHPGSQQSILDGQSLVSNIINKFMASSSWQNSVFFFSYDEGGGPYDHVPPVPGHSNQNTDASLGSIPDISQIAVNPDSYNPCLPATAGQYTLHCDLRPSDPGAHSGDVAAVQGFAAQLGFRVPNIIISPFTRKHYVSHTPMDHTAVVKFVESRFISSSAHLTNRDAAQPNLLDFFDFNAMPWSTPPTPPPPVSKTSLGYDPCLPQSMGP